MDISIFLAFVNSFYGLFRSEGWLEHDEKAHQRIIDFVRLYNAADGKKIIAKVALKSTKTAHSAASFYGPYQPKEPTNLKKMLK